MSYRAFGAHNSRNESRCKGTFAAVPSRSESERFLFPAIHSSNEHYRFVEKAGALQAGIRVGRLVVGRDHPDHHILRVLNTVLGGYFGSRLMSIFGKKKDIPTVFSLLL